MIERINLGQLTQDRSLSGNLSESNTLDIYSFELNNITELNLSFSGNSNNQDNILGVIIWQDQDGDNSYDTDEKIDIKTISSFPDSNTFDLPPLSFGEYKLSVVITEDSPTVYDIELNQLVLSETSEPSNSYISGISNNNINIDSSLSSPIYRFHNTAQPGTYLFASSGEGRNILDNPNYNQFEQEGFAFAVGTSNNDDLILILLFEIPEI